MGKKIIFFILIFSFFINNLPGKKKEGTIPFSYIIPGVEQIKRGSYLKGVLFFTSFSFCLTEAFLNNRKGNDYYQKYLKSKILDEIILFRRQTETSFKNRNYYLIGAFSIWFLNILDLHFFDKKKGIKGEIYKNSFSLGFYYSF